MKGHAVEDIRFSANELTLTIDGKRYRFNLAAISARLADATPEERADMIVSPSGYGIHWSRIDEDLSIDGLLRGLEAKAPATRGRSRVESRPAV